MLFISWTRWAACTEATWRIGFYLIDKNMHPAIHLGFHGHNNLQLAFSNAQVLLNIRTCRTLILDASVYGMGRGAGNCHGTDLPLYQQNRRARYDVTAVMDLYDAYIADIRKPMNGAIPSPIRSRRKISATPTMRLFSSTNRPSR